MNKYLSFYTLLTIIFSLISIICSLNKYSKEANEENVEQNDRPFRMLKLNQLWQKANQRLDGQKLKNLMSDLKLQDKDEITLKKLKTDGQDKDGVKESQLRKRLNLIIEKYGLTDSFNGQQYSDNNIPGNTNSDQYLEKQLFKDKKLDKLWKKAEMSGLTEEQLIILKEEFRHHEEKIEQYYQLIEDINKKEDIQRTRGIDSDNSINRILNEEDLTNNAVENDTHQALKDKHFEIKENYKRLTDKVVNNLDAFKKSSVNEFDEENVQNLWQLALKSNFNTEELLSLREELEHYQNRIRKLKHFESQLESDYIAGKDINDNNDEEFGDDKHLKRKVKELNHKVKKLHNELETRIMQRHIEL